MPDTAQTRFCTAELERRLLSIPFERDTNWHVITGAPCCGKTTLIEQLAALGYATAPEVGREYMQGEIAGGRVLDDIQATRVAVCYRIKDLQLALERGLLPQECLFMDRAFPDCLSFHRIRGLDPHELLPDCSRHRYASVFLLDRLPIQADGVRTEDELAADFLDDWLARDYAALGYTVVRVPVMSRQARLRFVLGWLAVHGLLDRHL